MTKFISIFALLVAVLASGTALFESRKLRQHDQFDILYAHCLGKMFHVIGLGIFLMDK